MVTKLQAFLVLLIIYDSQSDPVLALKEEPSSVASSCGFGFEILVSRMEYLEDKFLKQQSETRNLINLLGQNMKNMFLKQEQMFEQRLKNSLDAVKYQTELIKSNQNERIRISTVLSNIQQTVGNNVSLILDDLKMVKIRLNALPIRSCSDGSLKQSGQYFLGPFAGEEPFVGYCEQQKFEGGWLVIQHRFDGHVSFYRNWTEYKAGFGQPGGEFWLGLEKLHRLTTAKKHSLLVEVKGRNGKYAYAMYDHFVIGSEKENYVLKQLGQYSGSAGDSLKYHKGNSFTTKDKDNDASKDWSCAINHHGAWWYEFCAESHLNGLYTERDSNTANYWYHLNNDHRGLKMPRMMIREA